MFDIARFYFLHILINDLDFISDYALSLIYDIQLISPLPIMSLWWFLFTNMWSCNLHTISFMDKPSVYIYFSLLMFVFIYLQASFVLCRVAFKPPSRSSISENGLSSCAEESVSAVRHIGIQHDGSLTPDNEVDGPIVTGQFSFAIIGCANVNVFIELNAQVTFLNNFACWWFISSISFLHLVPKHSLTMSYFIISPPPSRLVCISLTWL